MKLLTLEMTLGFLLVTGVSFANPPPGDVRDAGAAKVEKILRQTPPNAEQSELFRKTKRLQEAQMRETAASIIRIQEEQRLNHLTRGHMNRTALLTICVGDVAELRKKDAKLSIADAKKRVLACELADTERAQKKEMQMRMQTVPVDGQLSPASDPVY